MKKIILSILTVAVALPALAGGLMTNTNQSASFLRSMARGTSMDSDAVYHNPAGLAFMENGWYFGLSDQMAYQTRTINSTFAPFAYGMQNGQQMTKEYTGDVFSALIPSFHLAWKKNRWSVMLGMGVNGGGGSLEFAQGLGSFERMFAVLPVAMNQAFGTEQLPDPYRAYNMDMYLKGNSMTLAFNLGAAFRITDWLSVSAMVRYSHSSNGYDGYLKNINVMDAAGNIGSASAIFGQAFQGLQGQLTTLQGQYEQLVAAGQGESEQAQQLLAGMTEIGKGMQSLGENMVKTADHVVDVKQKGYSISPVVALAFHHGKWDASIKYEFKMATELEIESAPISANDPVVNTLFPNGAKIKAETPALLAVAASRHCGPVKVTLEWHHFFDKDAENSFSNAVLGNTNEYLAGAEWTISKRWMVSLGAQRTQLNLDESKYQDMNYSISSTSVGLGLKFQITDFMALNAGVMKTFYDKDITNAFVDTTNPALSYTDVFNRTSISWGLGLDFKFNK